MSSLKVGYAGPDEIAAGNAIPLTIENTGGIDTTFSTAALSIVDSKGVTVYQGSAAGTINAGETKLLQVPIPSQAVSRQTFLTIGVKDNKTNSITTFYKSIRINGVTATLEANTDKEVYLKTEAITALSRILNDQAGIENGSLKVSVIGNDVADSGQFSLFAPKQDGYYSFNNPNAVAVGPDGSVYVADTNYHRIQKLDKNGNLIALWGGTGSRSGGSGSGYGEFQYPMGIAVGPDGYVYVADTYNNRVQKFDANGKFIRKWGTGGLYGNDAFWYPKGIAVGPDGSVYVQADDYWFCHIKKFDSNGNFILMWGDYGSGNGQFNYPRGLAAGADGSVYVADSANRRIQKFDSRGDFIAKWGSSGSGDGQFNRPEGVAVGADGSVFVVESYNNRVQKFDSNGNFITKWGGSGSSDGQFSNSEGVAVSPDGSVYVADTLNNRIQKFDNSGNFLAKWENSPGRDYVRFSHPQGVAVGPGGSVYVADTYANRIQKFDINGKYIAKWGSYGGNDGQFRYPGGIAADADGFVYVSDGLLNNRIQKFDINGSFVAKWGSSGSGDGQFYNPAGVAVGPDGSIYVADTSNHRVQKFDNKGNFIAKLGSYGRGDGQLRYPEGVAVTADGSVYVADTENNRILKFDNGGNFIAKWGSYGSGDGQFDYPKGVVASADGFVCVADMNNNRIQKFDTNGNFIAKWGSYGNGEGQFYNPYGLAVSADGSIFVADASNNRIQRMPVNSGVNKLFETSIPINQLANSTQNYTTNAGAFNTTGKLYLQAELTNTLGQTVAKAEYPFYIINGDTHLLFKTDKKTYKPGETVTITGEVRNLSAITASGLTLALRQQSTGGSQAISTRTFDVPAGGNYPFTAAVPAGGEGTFTLVGTVTQNNATLVEISDQYEVAAPKVAATVTAPDTAGNDPFAMDVQLKNDGKVEATVNLQTSFDPQIQTVTVQPGETRLIQYRRQITADAAYTFTFTGDLNQTVIKTVKYGLAATLTFNPQPIYPEGKVAVPVTIGNTGLLDGEFAVDYRLVQGGNPPIQETRKYFLPKGTRTTDTLYFDLAEGGFQLAATGQSPTFGASASFAVRKEIRADLALSTGAQAGELLPVTVNVTNLGYDSIEGSVRLSFAGADGAAVWSAVQDTVLPQSPTPSPQSLPFTINLSALKPGNYTIKAELLNAGDRQLAVQSLPFAVRGPVFELTQVPPYQTFQAGGRASMLFKVKNSGNQEGAFDFTFKADDLIDSTRTEWLKPGEEKELSFSFGLPGDLEEKDYFAAYSLKRQGAETGERGSVKYHLQGINITVSASLDKRNYREGETAALTLTVSQSGDAPQSLFARVNYAGFEEKRAFTLRGSQTLAFAVPLTKITGEKLFYGIYSDTGRSVHLNSLYIYRTGDVITVTTDKQLYNPGETVTVAVTGSASGELTLSGPGGFSNTLDFSGSATRGFSLPATMTAGTYSINAQLKTQNSEVVTVSYPFDVAGIQVRVKEATLDKPKYAATDTMKLALTIESNLDIPATIKTWVVDPAGNYAPAGESVVDLTSVMPSLKTLDSQLSTASLGIHRLVYGIYQRDLLLVSGSEAFDVGEAALLGLATDKGDYPAIDLPVSLKTDLYGTTSVSLEFFLDGTGIKSDTVNLAGFSASGFSIPPASLTPGSHKLKAVLTAGGLTSVKETSFTYGSSLPDLTTYLSVEPVKNSTVALAVTVANQGKTAAGPESLTLYDGDPAAGGMAITSLPVPALEPGSSATLACNWSVLGKAGEHVLYAVADSGKAVVEFNEGNNTASYPVSLPNLVLDITTGKPVYKANEEVGVAVSLANLTSTVAYANANLKVELADPTGKTVVLSDKTLAALQPASETASVANWNTASNPPGDYSLAARLLSGATELAASRGVFAVESTPSLAGAVTTQKDETIQGFPLAIDFTLTNNGNIDLPGGEATAELIEKAGGTTAKSLSRSFAPLPLLQRLSQNLNVERVDVQPGDYTLRLTASVVGASFLIGEKALRVLPPLEVSKTLSVSPRVLVLVGNEVVNPQKTPEEIRTEALISQALSGTGGFYRVVDDVQIFKKELRTGYYNTYILTGSKPLTDHLDEELRERVNAGDGLVLLDYGKTDDVKFRELPGIMGSGYLTDQARRLDLLESPLTRPGTCQVTGKARKVTVESPHALVAGLLYDGGKTTPALIINPYGGGKVVTFAFMPDTSLIRDAVGYAVPQQVDIVAATPLPVETALKSIGGAFELRVSDEADLPVLLSIPAAEVTEKSATWRFSLGKDELKKLIVMRKLPEEGGSFELSTTVDYLRDSGYQPYKGYHLAATVDKGVVDLKAGILNGLKTLKVPAMDANRVAAIVGILENTLNRPTGIARDVEQVIKDLIRVVGEVRLLSVDTAAIRLDLDRLLRVYGRLWTELEDKPVE